jgi:hypothetical protein
MNDFATLLPLSPSFNRARSLSRLLTVLFSIGFWLMLAMLVATPLLLVWPQATDAQWAMVPIAGKSFGPRAGAILSLAAGIVPSLCLLHHARRLFAHFAKGEVFNTASIGHIRAAGLWLLISPFANIAMQMGLRWTIDAPAHDLKLNPQTLIFGIATFIAAYVMAEAQRIADENASIL